MKALQLLQVKITIKLFLVTLLLAGLYACDAETPAIDDTRIFGGWHLQTIIEDGLTSTPQDSILYIFSEDGIMQIKTFRTSSASPADLVNSYSLENGTLRYWNYDYNVNEEKQIYFNGNYLTIQMYTNTRYNLSQIF